MEHVIVPGYDCILKSAGVFPQTRVAPRKYISSLTERSVRDFSVSQEIPLTECRSNHKGGIKMIREAIIKLSNGEDIGYERGSGKQNI